MSGCTRRDFVSVMAAGTAALSASTACAAEPKPVVPRKFRLALNSGTIRAYQLPLEEQIRLAIETGFEGIEPWLADLAAAEKVPGTLARLNRLCAEAHFTVIGGIGFAEWIVNDAAARAAGLEQMKRDMELVAKLGGRLIAAPPMGAKAKDVKIDLDRAVERYRAILELGDQTGVVPELEFWGHSANLSCLSQALYIAEATHHPKACVLADVFHIYKGEGDFSGVRFLSPATAPVFHLNDAPAFPLRAVATDRDRVWPGDGIAPIQQILDTFRANQMAPWLSLELFNATYQKMPVTQMLQVGLGKMRACVAHKA